MWLLCWACRQAPVWRVLAWPLRVPACISRLTSLPCLVCLCPGPSSLACLQRLADLFGITVPFWTKCIIGEVGACFERCMC